MSVPQSHENKMINNSDLCICGTFLHRRKRIIFKKKSRLFICANTFILFDFSLTVNAATLIVISVRGSAIASAKEGKSGFIYNLVKS